MATGNIDETKDTGQIARIDSYIGGTISNPTKQWQQRFEYDELARLREVREHRGDTNALSYKYKFDFDRFGNLYRKAASNPASGQETPLAYQWIENSDIDKTSNRLSSATGTQYDDEGNVTQDTKFRGMEYKYDANGRMVWSKLANNSGADATSVYNALGQRVATKVDGNWNIFVYDFDGKIIAESGFTAASDEGGIKYYLQDRLDSTSAVLSQSGFVKSRSNYQAFGEEIGANIGMRTTAQGFNPTQTYKNKYAMNERDDATGLYHTWWRKLESQAGRWTSPDSYKGAVSLGDPQSFNRYSYVTNDPVNSVDPTGLYEACAHAEMTRFIGKLAGMRGKALSEVAKFAGGSDINSADGSIFAATTKQNLAECVSGKKNGHFKTIHFPSKAQIQSNRKSYKFYMRRGLYKKAGHMIHSVQDGIGSHNEYKTCGGHGLSDGAKGAKNGALSGAVKGGIVGGALTGSVGGVVAGAVVGENAGAIAGAVEGAHMTDRELGDQDFVDAANATYQTMSGKSGTLTDQQINELVQSIITACAGNKNRWFVTISGGMGATQGSNSGGGGGGRDRQFDWLYWANQWTWTDVRNLD